METTGLSNQKQCDGAESRVKILNILENEAIIADLKAQSKKEVLEELANLAGRNNDKINVNNLVEVLIDREKLGSTGIGDGVAIPHGRLENIEEVVAIFGKSIEGIDFDSMDGKKAHLFFLLVAHENSNGVHLKALAKISKFMKNPEFRMNLMEAKLREDIYRVFSDEDTKY